MYVIQDVKTGRFLSQRSIMVDATLCLYTTYTGKLGTIFFKSRSAAETVLAVLQKIFADNNISKIIHITQVNTDMLSVGERISEIIYEIV